MSPDIVFIFNDTVCFKIDEWVLKSFALFRKFFTSNNKDIINNIISSSAFQNSNSLYYSNIMHLNFKNKTLLFDVPIHLYKKIFYYSLENKSDYIKNCVYFNIQLKFTNANLKQIFNYLGIPISFTYECEKFIYETLELELS